MYLDGSRVNITDSTFKKSNFPLTSKTIQPDPDCETFTVTDPALTPKQFHKTNKDGETVYPHVP
jgi:hypothetical protein